MMHNFYAVSYFSCLLCILLCLCWGCNAPDTSEEEQAAADTTASRQQDTAAYAQQSYNSSSYQFAMSYPRSWQLLEDTTVFPIPIINVYQKPEETQLDLPITIHTEATVSYVGIYPEGFGTELPFGSTQRWNALKNSPSLSFEVKEEESMAYLLEDGSVWGYFLVPAAPPQGWKDGGFIFAQIAVDSLEVRCFDKSSGEPKDMASCDPMQGDRIERDGRLQQAARQKVENILHSLHFTAEQTQPTSGNGSIQLRQPGAGERVASPLTITGKARGSWYFEASFPLELTNEKGKVLAQGTAQAQGPWMTEELVPFEARLQFQAPAAGEGTLILRRANPSGRPENSDSMAIPVVFSGQAGNR